MFLVASTFEVQDSVDEVQRVIRPVSVIFSHLHFLYHFVVLAAFSTFTLYNPLPNELFPFQFLVLPSSSR